MKQTVVALFAAISFLLLAAVPGAGAQNVGEEVYNDGTIYIGNGQCQGPKGNVFPCDFGGGTDGGSTDGATDAGGATATDGASTDGYVPGGTGGTDAGTQEPNCGPGPNGYTWYQDPCPPEFSDSEPGPNCGPGPNGYMWYQDPCPAEYSGTAGQPGATDGAGGGKDDSAGQGTKKGATNIQVVDEKGDILATANGDQAVITVEPAGEDRNVMLVDADNGDVLATSTVVAGGTVAAAKAPAAAIASAAALPNTGASSTSMAQLALILVAAGGVLVLVGKRSGTVA